jgi:hypothetical protein
VAISPTRVSPLEENRYGTDRVIWCHIDRVIDTKSLNNSPSEINMSSSKGVTLLSIETEVCRMKDSNLPSMLPFSGNIAFYSGSVT